MDAKLLSYNTEDYPTKAHMEMKITEFLPFPSVSTYSQGYLCGRDALSKK